MNTNIETRVLQKHPQLKEIFPSEKDIPNEYNFEKTIEQTEYLINGEIRTWDQAFEDVYSPVCIQNEKGELTPKRLGKYPILNEQETLLALDSASKLIRSGDRGWLKGNGHQ